MSYDVRGEEPSVVSGRALFDGLTRWLMPSAACPATELGFRRLWSLAIVLALSTLTILAMLGFRGEPLKLAVLVLSLPVTGWLVRVFRARTGLQTVPLLLESALLFMFATLFVTLLSFAAAAAAFPLRDAELAAFDRAIGFDWQASAGFVQETPWLRAMLRWSYGTIAWQPLTVLVVLVLANRHQRAQVFTAAWLVAAVACIALSVLVPAQSPYGYWQLEPILDYPLSAAVPRALALFDVLRAGGHRELFAFEFEGIVTFPSFHTLCGVLFAWALWPVRLLRWPALAVNVAMIASTPVVGSHYLVDVLVALMLAPFAISAGRIVVRGNSPRAMAR